MSSRTPFQSGLLAAVLGVALCGSSQAGDVVNDASFAIEFKYVAGYSDQGFVWSDSVIIHPDYMVRLPALVDGKPVLAIWRPAGTPGDGGWGYITGIDPVKTGYIGEYLTISFQ